MRIRVARSSALVFGILNTPEPKKAIRGKFKLVIFVSFRSVNKNFSLVQYIVSLVITCENSNCAVCASSKMVSVAHGALLCTGSATLGLSSWLMISSLLNNPGAYLTGMSHGMLLALLCLMAVQSRTTKGKAVLPADDSSTVKEAAATPRTLVRDLAIIPTSLTVEAPPTASAKTTTYTIEEFEKRKQAREPMSSVRRSARTPKRNGH